MRADSTLTASQREELVALFEQGFSYGAAANRVGVRHGPAKNLLGLPANRGHVVELPSG